MNLDNERNVRDGLELWTLLIFRDEAAQANTDAERTGREGRFPIYAREFFCRITASAQLATQKMHVPFSKLGLIGPGNEWTDPIVTPALHVFNHII